MTLRERQEEREAAQRQAALGKRATAINEGHLGPVLKRWINADVAPIAHLLREAARAYLSDDMALLASLLDTPSAELIGAERERPLTALMQWALRGSSPGRVAHGGAGESTYADDIALAFMATCITRIAGDSRRVSLAAVLASSSDAIRQTVLGQFISDIQGAKAMQAVRERRPEAWQQKKSLSRICAMLTSQAKPLLKAMELEGVDSVIRGNKTVIRVQNHKNEERMLTLSPPDAVAWEVMSLCWDPENTSATNPNRSLWLGFAGMVLAAAQRCGGWFEVAGERVGRKGHTRTTKYLVLSDAAHEAIKKDTERWLGAGFVPEPMIVPPENGDYLTVKHRPITGQRPPKGLLTNPKGTTSWTFGAAALANTPWTVNVAALEGAWDQDDANSVMRVAAHRRLAAEEAFYLPTTMDFRGRVYYRTPWVSPQSGDLGKSLLCFPPQVSSSSFLADASDEAYRAVVMHMAGLYGGPEKLDKARYGAREDWWRHHPAPYDDPLADKPLTMSAHWALLREPRGWDRIPIQLDGTCNGLQHLSALFRDEEAAKHVNLVRSTLEDAPADIYGSVAAYVYSEMARLGEADDCPLWLRRMKAAGIRIDRKLTKGPVMVLPYGGTREAVRLAVKQAVLDQLGSRQYGTEGNHKDLPGVDYSNTPWHHMEEDGYGAFRGRDLFDHPGFNTDVGALSALVWASISPAIPRAMAAMSSLSAIGGFVGDRGLSWRVGLGPVEDRLWVTQAKSLSQRKQVRFRGFHLPDMVRRLTLMAHTNDVDPKGHKTGIVANFIHSQDAAHLAGTVELFRSRGGGCVGAVHDCLMVRPSEAKLMGECLRDAFVALYEDAGDPANPSLTGPLSQPVTLIATVDGEEDVRYSSWYELAEAAGVAFPDRGSFDIREVRESAWFFS